MAHSHKLKFRAFLPDEDAASAVCLIPGEKKKNGKNTLKLIKVS